MSSVSSQHECAEKQILRRTIDSDYPILSIYIPPEMDEDVMQMYLDKADKHNHMFEYDTHCDAGFDLFVPNDTSFKFSERLANSIDHGIICKMECYYGDCFPHEIIPLSYFLYPRSSISKTPLRISNSVGIIDSGYRGNIIAKVDCLLNDSSEKTTNSSHVIYQVEKKTRLFQICAPDLKPFYVNITTTPFDNDTTRGSGGCGSTGMNS